MALIAIPREVEWSYAVAAAAFAAGVAAIVVRGRWQESRGLEKLILLGPLFYAVPLAAFGTEHFTLTAAVASIVPKFMPWHLFWAYFVGACFLTAAFSMVTGIQARLAAILVGITFFLFVVLMDLPAWSRNLHDRFGLTFALRELAFSGGAFGFAASLSGSSEGRGGFRLATIARYFVGIAVLFYSFEQFLHGDHVPGVPLEPLTWSYVIGHAVWTYVAAAVYAVCGIPLLLGKNARTAAACIGATVVVIVLGVYVPFAVVQRGSIEGLNYLFDTMMFGGAVLLVAAAMPRSPKAG